MKPFSRVSVCSRLTKIFLFSALVSTANPRGINTKHLTLSWILQSQFSDHFILILHERENFLRVLIRR